MSVILLSMPRPKKDRIIDSPPLFHQFKPTAVPMSRLEKITLELDELEAIRLADYLGMDHADAAKEMDISRPTFSRLVETARKKTARFLIEGGALLIGGGPVHFRGNRFRCTKCGQIIEGDMKQKPLRCSECGSKELQDMAQGFGHGKCCSSSQS